MEVLSNNCPIVVVKFGFIDTDCTRMYANFRRTHFAEQRAPMCTLRVSSLVTSCKTIIARRMRHVPLPSHKHLLLSPIKPTNGCDNWVSIIRRVHNNCSRWRFIWLILSRVPRDGSLIARESLRGSQMAIYQQFRVIHDIVPLSEPFRWPFGHQFPVNTANWHEKPTEVPILVKLRGY